MTITIGWWALPLLVTIALFAWAFIIPAQKGGGYGVDLMPLLRLGAAAILSLSSWLIWALLS